MQTSFHFLDAVVNINITSSGEATVNSTFSLNCSVTSNIDIDWQLLLWKAPNGVIIVNRTGFTAVNGGGFSSSLVLQLGPITTSDAGHYICEMTGQSSGHQIASSKDYNVTIQSECDYVTSIITALIVNTFTT